MSLSPMTFTPLIVSVKLLECPPHLCTYLPEKSQMLSHHMLSQPSQTPVSAAFLRWRRQTCSPSLPSCADRKARHSCVSSKFRNCVSLLMFSAFCFMLLKTSF